MSDRLWEIASFVRDAFESIENAIRVANRINSNAPDNDAGGWPALNATIENLEQVREELRTLVPPEMTEAIKQEADYLDEMADRADGASY